MGLKHFGVLLVTILLLMSANCESNVTNNHEVKTPEQEVATLNNTLAPTLNSTENLLLNSTENLLLNSTENLLLNSTENLLLNSTILGLNNTSANVSDMFPGLILDEKSNQSSSVTPLRRSLFGFPSPATAYGSSNGGSSASPGFGGLFGSNIFGQSIQDRAKYEQLTERCQYLKGPNFINVFFGGKFSKDYCPSDSEYVSLSKYSEIILNSLNKLRNDIASGTQNRYPAAAAMNALEWDEGLVRLAENHLYKCHISKDDPACFPLVSSYKSVGQAIYGVTKPSAGFVQQPPLSLFQIALKTWKKELNDKDAANIERYTRKNVSIYAILVDRAQKVGCAGRRTPRYMEILCNFDAGIRSNDRVYVQSSRSAAKCQSTHTKYPSLCAKWNIFDILKF